MPHMRNRNKRRHLDFKQPIWKVIDDYSGQALYSYQVTVDYQGFIVKAGTEDIEPPAEHPIEPYEQNMPFTRDGRE